MLIGTPLSTTANKVMLLGGGELCKEIVINLQRLGIETVVVDRYAHAPAQQVAHRYHVIDMTDSNQLRNIIQLEHPQIIIPEIEAIATDVLSNLPSDIQVIPNTRAVALTMNRRGIRELAANTLKLPTSKFKFAASLDELKEYAKNMGYPCFIKPIMSSSGKGQSYVHNMQELEQAWQTAHNSGRVNQLEVIIESPIDFDYEITLLTIRSLNHQGEIITSYCNPIGHIQVHGDYVESWQPQHMNADALSKAQSIAKTITDNLGGVGLFGVEMFVKKEQVWFSEVSPRPHDTGLVTMITQYQDEFELHVRAILGLPINTLQKEIGASSVIYGNLDKSAITFHNLDKALNVPNTQVRLFGKPESFIKRRMGVALSWAVSVDIARTQAKLCSSLITTT